MRPPECDLPLTEPKCMPRNHCGQATTCARWLVGLTTGRPVADMSLSPMFVQGRCLRYLPAGQHRKQAPAAPAPTVHDTPAGLA